MPCTGVKCSCDMIEVMALVSALENEEADILRLISVYTLNMDGIENGISSLKSTISHKTRKVFLGRIFIAIVRIIMTAIINTDP